MMSIPEAVQPYAQQQQRVLLTQSYKGLEFTSLSLADGVHSPAHWPLHTPGEGSMGSVSPKGTCSGSENAPVTGASGVGLGKHTAFAGGLLSGECFWYMSTARNGCIGDQRLEAGAHHQCLAVRYFCAAGFCVCARVALHNLGFWSKLQNQSLLCWHSTGGNAKNLQWAGDGDFDRDSQEAASDQNENEPPVR